MTGPVIISKDRWHVGNPRVFFGWWNNLVKHLAQFDPKFWAGIPEIQPFIKVFFVVGFSEPPNNLVSACFGLFRLSETFW